MIENIEESVNRNLGIISERHNNQMFFMEFEDLEGRQMNDYYRSKIFASKMEERELISIHNELCTVTELGFSIYKNGGWLNYLDLLKEKENLTRQAEEQKEIIKKAKEEIEVEKLINDSKISKLNAKYRYLPYVFTAIGLLISIISLIVATKSKKEPTIEKQLSKTEILKIIDSISTSNQTKKVDSLHSSKTQLDSLLKK